ncbi:MAG TPA: ABC transporter substrate-binding protein [Conexibacter sp.]|jgi:NitT/TauT family transport system substrate-binding protein
MMQATRPTRIGRLARRCASRRHAAIAGAAALTIAVAGCGGSSDNSATAASGGSSSGKLTTVRVGVLPIGTQVPLYLGIRHGFFRAEGIDVQPQVMSGGSAIVPALLQGSLQLGFVNGATIVFGAGRGLPIEVVAAGEGAPLRGNRDEDLSRLVVAKDSPIRTARDLDGKTIAVSGLRDAPELLTRAALAKEGVDLGSLRFQEIGYADMLAALDAHRVDAAYLVTPFGEQAERDGDVTLARPYYDTQPGLGTAYYATSRQFAQQSPQVVAGFQRAMLKSVAYANAHIDEARRLLPSFTTIPADVVPRVNFGHFPETRQEAVDSLNTIGGLMTDYRWIDSTPDIDALVFNPDAR